MSVDRLAEACARRLPATGTTFAGDVDHFRAELQSLVDAIAAADQSFAFDPVGRPAAIAAVRSALPTAEAELLDAVLEDMGCELAATREALYRVARAARGSGR
jgi:hypothetical protein